MEGGIVIRSTAGKEMLGSSFTRGAEAVGGEAVRLDGRPRKVDRLIDSSSEKEDRPYRCRRLSRCARMRATEDVEFQALPPPDSATGGEIILHGERKIHGEDAPLLGSVSCTDNTNKGEFILFGEIGEPLVGKQKAPPYATMTRLFHVYNKVALRV